VFPARYELNSYIVFRKRLVSKRLREQHRLRVFEERMLRRIFGPKGDEERWRNCFMRIFINLIYRRM
jgi:hypothetical protein